MLVGVAGLVDLSNVDLDVAMQPVWRRKSGGGERLSASVGRGTWTDDEADVREDRVIVELTPDCRRRPLHGDV